MDDKAKASFRLRTLHEAIAAVCPIDGAWLGDPLDRQTWGFWPKEEATQGQKDAGDTVIQTLDVETPVITEETRAAAVEADTGSNDFIARVRAADPAEVRAWLAANCTNLAEAREILARIILYLARRA